MLVEFLILLTSALLSAYMFLTRHHDHWKKKGVKHLKPKLIFGNIYDMAMLKSSIGEQLASLYRIHPEEPYIGFFSFDKPALLIRDLELIKHILIKDFNHFPDRVFSPNESVDPLAAKGLFGLNNPKWNHVRNKLNPGFTALRIKRMFCLVDDCCTRFINIINEYAQSGQPVELKKEMAKLTTTVIAACGFGLDAGAMTGNYSAFVDINEDSFSTDPIYALKKVLLFFAPHFSKTFNIKIAADNTYKLMRDIVWDTVALREKTGVNRNDFLDLVMEIRKNGSLEDDLTNEKFELDGDDLVAQNYLFLIAGFETSSTTLSLIMYELSMQPKLQDRLRKNILDVLAENGGKLSYEAVQDMKYLEQVVQESLRKYPPLPFLDRMCMKDYILPGTDILIEKGTQIYIPIKGLHSDPQYYTNPDIYDPERFNSENAPNIPKMAYIPFGEGKRICVAARFGEFQVKMGIIHFLTNFAVELAPGMTRNATIEPKSFTMLTRGGIHVIIKNIKS